MRHADRSKEAADMRRFWLGRSAAGRVLGARNHRKGPGEHYPPKPTNYRRLRGVFLQQRGKVPKTKLKSGQVQPRRPSYLLKMAIRS